MSKDAKLIRGQLRQIAKEFFQEEMSQEIYRNLLDRMQARMDVIARGAQDTMDRVEERQKRIQSLVLDQYKAAEELKKKS